MTEKFPPIAADEVPESQRWAALGVHWHAHHDAPGAPGGRVTVRAERVERVPLHVFRSPDRVADWFETEYVRLVDPLSYMIPTTGERHVLGDRADVGPQWDDDFLTAQLGVSLCRVLPAVDGGVHALHADAWTETECRTCPTS